MEDQKRTTLRNQNKKKYLLKDRFLPLSGALEWPLFFTIVRRVGPKKKTFQELTQEALLKAYAPVAVLVDQLGNIRYVHGHTGLFLEPAQGYTGVTNILKMARKKLRRDLNTTLYQAVTSRSASASPVVTVRRNGETMGLTIRVTPLLKQASIGQNEDFFLVIFEQNPDQQGIPASAGNRSENSELSPVSQDLIQINDEIESQKTELSRLNTELENTRQELEVARNKLHAVKANIYGSETDLQSLTEKVQASKDELEILGDKLLTAKNEHAAKRLVEQTIDPDRLPIREELDVIKNELFMANQALEEKKEALEKLDIIDTTLPGGLTDGAPEADLEIDPVNQFAAETIIVTDEEAEAGLESWDYQPEQEFINTNHTDFTINEKGMGFFSKNEPKPFFPKNPGLNSGNDPEPFTDLAGNQELVFKDAASFQAAANHGYRHDNEIKSVYIPEGVEVIKRSMFYKCSQLETITFPNTLKAIEDFAFYGCEALKKIDLNHCKMLEVIGTSAFEGCQSLSELIIPDALIEIEEAAFLGCRGLKSVEFYGNSQLEMLGSHVFKDCDQISRIILPDQLKHIGISCFYGCKNLIEIHLPGELETIGEYAFFGCNALEKIDFSNQKILKQPGFSVGFPEGIKL